MPDTGKDRDFDQEPNTTDERRDQRSDGPDRKGDFDDEVESDPSRDRNESNDDREREGIRVQG
ncbi:MAG TPA: hypothetical protein VN783_04730, partial [Thermoanaerobaculia bacterium]|nr:hypothetical protein [Thermoanaerobaculia bacterium]